MKLQDTFILWAETDPRWPTGGHFLFINRQFFSEMGEDMDSKLEVQGALIESGQFFDPTKMAKWWPLTRDFIKEVHITLKR